MSGDTTVVLNVVDPMALVPGTKVLISIEGRPTLQYVQKIQDALHDRFPGVEFTIINGQVQAVMQPVAVSDG